VLSQLGMASAVQAQTPLPAARDPLLSRWQQPAKIQSSAKDPLSQMMSMIDNGSCTALFGDGGVEFRADRRPLVDSDGVTDVGPVSCRQGKDNVLFVLPQQDWQPLPLILEAPDRWSLLAGAAPWAMVRVGASQSRAAPGITQSGGSAAVTSAKRAVGPDAGG
jgi:hypothetical protein